MHRATELVRKTPIMRSVISGRTLRLRRAFACVVLMFSATSSDASQEASHYSVDHKEFASQHTADRPEADSPRWRFMHDGVAFLTFNRQGGSRGDTELVSQNWWMGMGRRPLGSGTLTMIGMLSLEPLTVGGEGYSEIFQTGEAFRGRPITDRQHPHDFVMQLAASWRIPLTQRTGFTLAGGPAGEATLGPVAFMHRQSAAENPFAPLGHHTFDSTHLAKGVLAAGVDHGPWAIEASVFHGREPDEHRWNLNDVGALDSWATRLWFRPGTDWEFQVSHGFLKDPEELEPGNVRRTTASASWARQRGPDFVAITAGYGRNDAAHGVFDAVFAEGTHRFGAHAVYARFELVDVETDLFLGELGAESDDHALRDTVGAFTIGALHDVPQIGGFELGVGADATFHTVPDRLQVTHGSHSVSFKVFFRIRPPLSGTRRMWEMTMTRPMAMRRE